MAREEARDFLIAISYKLGSMAVEYLTEKDGEKMREAIETLGQTDLEQYEADLQDAYDCGYNCGYADAMNDWSDDE